MASGFRFGTTCSPSRTAAAGTAQQAEDDDGKANTDPDRLVQCPFDKHHQIRLRRLPYHILKCRKNHPQLARELKTCPFSASHLVPKHELAHHIETCENRTTIFTAGTTDEKYKRQVPVSNWVNSNMTEDWDAEADDNAPPFVWGVSRVLNEHMEIRLNNCLDPGVRAPRAFPQ